MSVSKIKATLPKGGHANGLDAIAPALAADPHKKRVIIMIVDCGRVQLDHPDDDDGLPPGLTATARIRRVEAIDGEDADMARRLLVRANEKRLGRTTLDFDTETVVRGLFGNGNE